MNFKYALDKSSKKFLCPSCGKKTFVKFLDTTTNNYLKESLGRCDRESNCGCFNSPSSNKPLSVITNYAPPIPTFHDLELIDIYCKNYDNNQFIQYLLISFSEESVIQAIEKYLVGTSDHWKGATIFYQIDQNFNICAGKVMLYDCNTGKRVKKPLPHINWLHSVLRLDNFVLQQCLFGLHLAINYNKQKTICLVESEKTAIVMSIQFPKYIWLATGSKANLKLKLLKPIKQYSIIVFPDKSEFNDWNAKVDLFSKNGFSISCSGLLENKNISKGDDLVDFLETKKN
jgi:hypothetical protein